MRKDDETYLLALADSLQYSERMDHPDIGPHIMISDVLAEMIAKNLRHIVWRNPEVGNGKGD